MLGDVLLSGETGVLCAREVLSPGAEKCSIAGTGADLSDAGLLTLQRFSYHIPFGTAADAHAR